MFNNVGAVCIGDPFTPCPSPREWLKNHHGTKSLILTTPTTANPLAFSHDLTVATTLRELHVKNPVYLALKLASAKSPRHWLHDIAMNNRSLEKLTLERYLQNGFVQRASRADPPTKLTKSNFWKLSLEDLDTMILGMPLLTTVKVDRVAFVEQYPGQASVVPHDGVLQVFKNVHSNLSSHFPRAVILPYKK
ncbi:MAG: hypothetical protein BYD32DRAFT_457138 [Podila humilis]|nr:MAG: hypothetical protein BYD32DRAFT_457138 [Podila humilis]